MNLLKKILLIAPLVFTSCFAWGQVYLDSEASEGGDGSISSPYNEISDISTFASNTTYYLKRGSNFYITSQILFDNDNTTMEAYGTGDIPRIWTDQTIKLWRGEAENPILKYIKFENTLPAACYNETPNIVNFESCNDGLAYHVETKGGGRGICSASNTGTLQIIGCYISKTDDDGSWFYKPRHIIIDSCLYDSVNRGYSLNCDTIGRTVTGGDCVQLGAGGYGDSTSLTIKNSTLDRRAYDYKFNIHMGCYDASNPDNWPSMFLYNVNLLHEGTDGSNLYTNEADSIVIDRCLFSGNRNGIYKGYYHGTQYIITRSIFEKHSNKDIWSQIGSADYDDEKIVLRNNTFVSGGSDAFVKYLYDYDIENCIFVDYDKVFYNGVGTATTDYNNYYNCTSNYKTDEANGIYADPLFTDKANSDYTLTSLSPVIDQGAAQTIGYVDLEGVTAPQGSGWDIGAYEYSTGSEDWCYLNPIVQSGVITHDTVPPTGNNTGAIDVTVVGGVGTIVHSWSSGETTEDISSKQYGSYTHTTTDDSLCVSITEYVITQIDTTTATTDGDSAYVNFAHPTVYNNPSGWFNITTNPRKIYDLANDWTLNFASQSEYYAGATGMAWGDSISQTYHYNNASFGPIEMYFGNLDNTKTYNLELLLSRETDSRINIVTIEGLSQTVDVQDNITPLYFNNVVPDGDSIYIKIDTTDGTLYSHINAIKIFEQEGVPSNPCDTTTINSTGVETPSSGSNGSIVLTVSGGLAPYNFLWSNGATTKDITGLAPDTYSVLIADDNGCTGGDSYTINNTSTKTSIVIIGGSNPSVRNGKILIQ